MKAPARVLPLGRLTDAAGRVLTTDDFALPQLSQPSRIPLIVVVGTSMISGKTAATVALTHGLTRAGQVVAAQGVQPLCLTGLLSCSPMASAEAEAMTGVAVVTRSALMDPAVASGILAMAQGQVPVAS